MLEGYREALEANREALERYKKALRGRLWRATGRL